MDPRKISVIYAPLWIAKAIAPAQKGVNTTTDVIPK